jgi:UPF0755 protein
MNKKKLLFLILLVPVIMVLVVAYLLFGPATRFSATEKYLYIQKGKANSADVMQQLQDSAFIRNTALFELLANKSGTWNRIRPGKYKVSKGSSLFHLVRQLRNNQQETVNLVITKLRTRQQLAGLVARKFECDSVTFLVYISSNDSLRQFDVDTTTLLSVAMPETYTYYWSVQPQAILKKLNNHYKQFWNDERMQKAQKIGLTPLQVSALASIVEEETIRHDEKPLIASVYLNRLKKNMFLGADPTVKYAVGDFSLRRVLLKHISSSASSPYNTYKNKGLPPGPICTPSAITIDAVLNAAETKYLFFCAKPNGNGYHAFAETDTEHIANARAYQKWLNEKMIK